MKWKLPSRVAGKYLKKGNTFLKQVMDQNDCIQSFNYLELINTFICKCQTMYVTVLIKHIFVKGFPRSHDHKIEMTNVSFIISFTHDMYIRICYRKNDEDSRGDTIVRNSMNIEREKIQKRFFLSDIYMYFTRQLISQMSSTEILI